MTKHTYFCIILWPSYLLRLWNVSSILFFNRKLTLQFWLADPLYLCHMAIISYSIIYINTYKTFISPLKIYFISFCHDKVFLKTFFHKVLTIFNFLKHVFNKLKSCIFIIILLHWFIKFLINTYKFVTITSSHMILICISAGHIMISNDLLSSFLYRFLYSLGICHWIVNRNINIILNNWLSYPIRTFTKLFLHFQLSKM